MKKLLKRSSCERVYAVFKMSHKFNSMAGLISSKLQSTKSDMSFRPKVGPQITVGQLFLTYSKGSSFSKRPDHSGKYGIKLWVPTASLDNGQKQGIEALYNQPPVRIGKWYKLPIETNERLDKLLVIIGQKG